MNIVLIHICVTLAAQTSAMHPRVSLTCFEENVILISLTVSSRYKKMLMALTVSGWFRNG